MTNDTSVQRTPSSDPNDTIYRRKANTDQLNLNQSSFFDELLSLGKFETQFPIAPAPVPPTAIKNGSRDESSDAQKSDQSSTDSSFDEESKSADATSLAYAAQLATQNSLIAQASTDVPNEEPVTAICRAMPSKKAKDPNDSETAIVSNGLNNEVSNSAKESEASVPFDNQNKALPTLLSSTDKVGPQANSPTTGLEETLNSKGQVTNPGDRIDSKSAKRDSHAQRSSTSSNKDQAVGESPSIAAKDTAVADSKQKDSKNTSKNRAGEHEPHVDLKGDSNKSANVEPRNRRAERLASQGRAEDRSDSSADKQTEQENKSASVSATNPNANLNPSAVDPAAFTLSTPIGIDPATQATTITSVPIVAVNVSTTDLATTANGAASRSLLRDLAPTAASSVSATAGLLTAPTSTGAAPQLPNGVPLNSSSQQAARPNAGTSISPYQEVKLVQRVLRGIEQLGNGGGQVKLRLHPPELGSLQLSMRVESGQMFAKLEVESTAARDTLLNNVQTLKDRLADQGIKVQAFDVQLSADASGSGTNGSSMQQNGDPNANSQWENATSRYAQRQSNRLSSDPIADRPPTQAWTRTNGSLDLTV